MAWDRAEVTVLGTRQRIKTSALKTGPLWHRSDGRLDNTQENQMFDCARIGPLEVFPLLVHFVHLALLVPWFCRNSVLSLRLSLV